MAKRGHGEGTVVRRKDGRWCAALVMGYDSEGKPIRKYFYGRTRREVQEKLEAAKAEARAGILTEPQKVSLGEWLSRWLEFYVKNRVRLKTYSLYHNAVYKHIIPDLGKKPLQKLTTAELQAFYVRKLKSGRLDGKGGLSTRMVHLFHQVINGALKQAVREGLMVRNPAEAVKLPRLRYGEMRPLTSQEVRRLLEAARGHRLYPALLLELATGLRRGELFALRWRDVDLEQGLVHVRRILHRVQTPNGPARTALVFEEPKTEKSKRTVPVPGNVVAELRAHRARREEEARHSGEVFKDENLVFTTSTGKPVDPDNLNRWYKELLRKAGLPPVRFHDLRHTFATLLLEADEHPKVVQEMLGHSRVGITLDLYTHVRPDLMRRAAEKVGEILRGGESPVPET